MDDRRVGAILRVLRRRLGLRQADVAARAGVSQQTVSLIERTQVHSLALRTIRAVFRVVGAEANLDLRWRGPELDRVLDEAHATLVGRFVGILNGLGWQTVVEATFSRYGERGSIDILAWHPAPRALLIVEVKSTLVSIEELLRRLDIKVRLAPRMAAESFGARPLTTSRIVVLPGRSTERARVHRHASVLAVTLPLRGRDVARWLQAPSTATAGILFLSDTHGRGATDVARAQHRVRRPPWAAVERGSASSARRAGPRSP